MVVKRCTTRTVLGMLNHAAQKFIFHGFGGRGEEARAPVPPMNPPLVSEANRRTYPWTSRVYQMLYSRGP